LITISIAYLWMSLPQQNNIEARHTTTDDVQGVFKLFLSHIYGWGFDNQTMSKLWKVRSQNPSALKSRDPT